MATFGKPTGLGAGAGLGVPAFGSSLGAPAFGKPAGLGAAVSALATPPLHAALSHIDVVSDTSCVCVCVFVFVFVPFTPILRAHKGVCRS